MPKRIQLSRRRGWRMPPNTVKVDRSTRWGNPFQLGTKICTGSGMTYAERKLTTAGQLVEAFREMLGMTPRNFPSNERIRAELSGKNLACWCPLDKPCHADVLLKLANDEESA
ncbi:MAG: DUF4326 domain-containing protein [Erythrobacter sp.]|nr:DUF4326 domain-containing protein [Erythrobacter sp.]MDZ4272953.1 DUF4326 domain-containing protein [Erythrobacter sp.]